jgi:hypothetical protein
MTDGRKTNKPPLRKPSISDGDVAVIDFFVHEYGARYPHLAKKMGVNKRTLEAAATRKGAYARIPAYVPVEQGEAS